MVEGVFQLGLLRVLGAVRGKDGKEIKLTEPHTQRRTPAAAVKTHTHTPERAHGI